MPLYVYGCGAHGNFEEYAGRDDSAMPCPICHEPARRRPYSSVPYLKGETVARSIPDPAYREDAERRELHRTWGTAERSMEMLRKNLSVNPDTGQKSIDLKAMNQT